MKTKLIAEIGCTHLGSKNVAFDMLDACIAAGITEVKGQVRWPQEKWKTKPRDVGYGKTYFEHQQAIELPLNVHVALKERAASVGVPYYVSVWDVDGAEWAGSQFDTVKIAAPLCERWELYDAACSGRQETRFYVSIPPLYVTKTGLALGGYVVTDDSDAKDVDVLERGLFRYPIKRLYSCVPLYPAPCASAPLKHFRGIDFSFLLRNCYVKKGISLHVHYPEILPVIYGAVAMGAEAIEFHVTPFTQQRQIGARMAVPIRALPELVQNVLLLEASLDSPSDEVAEKGYLDQMRKTIEGLR